MSAVYNPESDLITRIECLEIEARGAQKAIKQAMHPSDRRVLIRQMAELEAEMQFLRNRLPHPAER